MAYSIEFERQINGVAAQLGMHFKKMKMFGGLAYFVKGGNMAFAIRGDELLFRLHGGEADELLEWPGVHTTILGECLMAGWLQAGGEAIKPGNLEELITIGYDYALSLPPRH